MIIHGKHSVHPLFRCSSIQRCSHPLPQSFLLHHPLLSVSVLVWSFANPVIFSGTCHFPLLLVILPGVVLSASKLLHHLPCPLTKKTTRFASFSTLFFVLYILVRPCTSNPSFQITKFPLPLYLFAIFSLTLFH